MMTQSGRRSREWVYRQDRHDREYVVLDDSGLLWIWEGPKDLGGARDQSLADFLANGPPFAVPDGLASEIRAEILARAGDGRTRLESEAAAILGEGRVRRDAQAKAEGKRAGEVAAARALKDPWRSYAAGPPASAGMASMRLPTPVLTALVAAALFASAALIGAGLAWLDLSPALGFLGVAVATMAAGFALYLRLGTLSMLLAGFLAAGGASGTLYFAARLHELAGGELVRLASVTQAPEHANASRFVFAAAQPASAFRGTASGTRSAGKKKEPQRWSTLATPLVPAGWRRDQPVPAWLVCQGAGGDGSCLPRGGATLESAVIPPRGERADLRAAVDDALARHRLVEAKGAPMLVAMPDIDGEIDTLTLWTWCAPLGAFGLWLVAWLGGLAWHRFRR